VVRKIILSIFCLIFFLKTFPYTNVKVVLLANKDNQKDSLGYNIVTALCEWTYNQLREGKIKLWDSPYKNNEIEFNTLQGIENSSKTSFSAAQNIFIYETWTSDKKQTSFQTIGFGFNSESKTGEVISYGFLEYSKVADLLKKDLIPVNINGSYNTTFYQVLMNKRYDYDVVYFNDAPIHTANSKDPEGDFKRALKIKNKAFNSSKLNINYTPIKPSKLVVYGLKSGDYDIDVTKIIAYVEAYFNKNRKELFRFGGKELFNYFQNSKLIVSEIFIKEIWTQEGGKIYNTIVDMTINSIGISFIPITPEELQRLNILINQLPLTDVLIEKKFAYHLVSLNNIKLEESLADNYLKALKEGRWSKIDDEKK
jgi:hypothetical protein